MTPGCSHHAGSTGGSPPHCDAGRKSIVSSYSGRIVKAGASLHQGQPAFLAKLAIHGRFDSDFLFVVSLSVTVASTVRQRFSLSTSEGLRARQGSKFLWNLHL